MRNKRRTDEEWLSLIQECRSSGFSDCAWCEQNDIVMVGWFGGQRSILAVAMKEQKKPEH